MWRTLRRTMLLDWVDALLALRSVQVEIHGSEPPGTRQRLEELQLLPGSLRRLLLHPARKSGGRELPPALHV